MKNRDAATKFAQLIIDSTPRDQLSDYWVQFNDTFDINIWFDESPIYATLYPIRVDKEGNKYTDTHSVSAILNVKEKTDDS
jgi:hypothetical protein